MKEPDPLDEMRAAIEDGKQATKLLAYSEDFDEPTGRTEVTVNLQHPSQPEIKVESQPPGSGPADKVVRILGVPLKARSWTQVVALGIVVAGLAFVAWLKWGPR